MIPVEPAKGWGVARKAAMLLLTGTLLMVLVAWLGSRGYAVTYRWHSVLFHLGLLILLTPVVFGLGALARISASDSKILLISIASCLTFLELVVRLLGTETTYTENRLGWYQSSYQRNMEDPLRVHRHYREFWMETPEYRFHRTVNSHGFADHEFLPKREGEILIQTYGDSFTEGDGAPADSSYPALLRGILTENGMTNIKVQNFGMSGSDPGFYWRQLHDVGVQMNPDIVVMTYGSLDMTTDFFTRGGLGRFHDTRWSSLPGPWWEFVYANCHLFRWLARTTGGITVQSFLTTPTQSAARLRGLEPKWNEVFDSVAALSNTHRFKVFLVKKPERSEIDQSVYEYDFTFFDRYLANNPVIRHHDLLKFYSKECGLTGDSTARYYWEKDGHHNPVGYHLMATGVFHALKVLLPEKTDP